ncbi:MAG TPA: helix-turn-helix transcriptional regulator [Mycobacteriales bacterium]|nr:helix-turn-helix transcriptional regulator [Mycobacteriales bacterium]
MDTRNALREFLITRRGRITPQQAGLAQYGGRRRVPGLRRDELANLAGVSVEYYTKLERGNAHGVSDEVLEALSRALKLDDAERAHLFDLARASRPASRAAKRPARDQVRPSVQRLLDSMTEVPAIVQNGRLDLLASNRLGRALFSDLIDTSSAKLPNFARYTFLDARAVERYPDWRQVSGEIVALLQAEAGRSPDDQQLNQLVGELTTRSPEFGALWASRNVRWHTTGTKRMHHEVAGELTLAYEGLALTADPGQTLMAFTAEPGSASQQGLSFLTSWAAAATQVDEVLKQSDHATPESG